MYSSVALSKIQCFATIYFQNIFFFDHLTQHFCTYETMTSHFPSLHPTPGNLYSAFYVYGFVYFSYLM